VIKEKILRKHGLLQKWLKKNRLPADQTKITKIQSPEEIMAEKMEAMIFEQKVLGITETKLPMNHIIR